MMLCHGRSSSIVARDARYVFGLAVDHRTIQDSVTICSSVNRVFFMTPSLLRGRHSLKRQLVRKSPDRSARRVAVSARERLPQSVGPAGAGKINNEIDDWLFDQGWNVA